MKNKLENPGWKFRTGKTELKFPGTREALCRKIRSGEGGVVKPTWKYQVGSAG